MLLKKILVVCVSAFSILVAALCTAQAKDLTITPDVNTSLSGAAVLPDPDTFRERTSDFFKSLTNDQKTAIKTILETKAPKFIDTLKGDKKSVFSLNGKEVSDLKKIQQVKQEIGDIQEAIKTVLTQDQITALEAAIPTAAAEATVEKLSSHLKDQQNAQPQAVGDCYASYYYSYYAFYYAGLALDYAYLYALYYNVGTGLLNLSVSDLLSLAYNAYQTAYYAYFYSYYAYYSNTGYAYYVYSAYGPMARGAGYAVYSLGYDPNYVLTGSAYPYYAAVYGYNTYYNAYYGSAYAYYCY